jgi:hypothetical protein
VHVADDLFIRVLVSPLLFPFPLLKLVTLCRAYWSGVTLRSLWRVVLVINGSWRRLEEDFELGVA